ncbi:hypothetical protein H5410_056360 [Solanum commersonii]|uniref:MATH domain-containing protein n=1 Tax=Solanum commersonii TaxID=4109 RepID=A0A9J5WL28_SOLCO|nr:hypothetical protein H5410_056360 [Solanum commersonii]
MILLSCVCKTCRVCTHMKLRLYPRGDANENGQNISILLELVHANEFDSRKRVQKNLASLSKTSLFATPHFCWGWVEFTPLSEQKDPKKNFIVRDSCIVEADSSVLHVVNGLS